MKHFFIILSLTLFSTTVFSQSKEQIEKIESYKDLYTIEKGEVVFSKVIEDIPGTKDEIYARALSYFAIAYNSANDVIQMKDKDAGTVIGKGIFTVYKKENMISFEEYKCNHTLRIDAKEGRARVLITVNTYNIKIGKTDPTKLDMPIVDTYPLAAKPKGTKKLYADIFIKLCEKMSRDFAAIEKDLKATSGASKSDW